MLYIGREGTALHKSLMQKAGIATQDVARILLSFDIGDKLPTVTELCAQLDTARGNVQFALNHLKSIGAVRLNPRGHLGTYITGIDIMALAGVCGVDSLAVVMPLPYSKKYEGLATGLYTTLNTDALRTNIAFMRGSQNRLDMLQGGRYDMAVMSRMALGYYQKQGLPLSCIAAFGPRSYVNSHMVVLRAKFDGNWPGRKVGIDESSVDQKELTLHYFRDKDVELVPIMYSQILNYITDGTIDAAVWNIDDINLESGRFDMVDISDDEASLAAGEAVLVCRDEDSISRRIASEALDVGQVCRQQQQVESGLTLPRY